MLSLEKKESFIPGPHTLEKLRKLAPVGRRKADLGWLFYLSGEGEERQSADELLDILLFQQVQKGYKEQIFLDPPIASTCGGEYSLGTVSAALFVAHRLERRGCLGHGGF